MRTKTMASRKGISPAYHRALQDKESRFKAQKSITTDALEKVFRDSLKDVNSFEGVILKLQYNRDLVVSDPGSNVVDYSPVFYKAFVRVLKTDSKTLSSPCDFEGEARRTAVALHGPELTSKMISIEQASRLNLQPGSIVTCTPVRSEDGSIITYTFDPASVRKPNTDFLKKHNLICLKGRKATIIGGGEVSDPNLLLGDGAAPVTEGPSSSTEIMNTITEGEWIGKKRLGTMPQINKEAFDAAMIAFEYYNGKGKIPRQDIIMIIDWRITSTKPRLWVFDISSKSTPKAIGCCHVTHATTTAPKGSSSLGRQGKEMQNAKFYNTYGSNGSTLGAMITLNKMKDKERIYKKSRKKYGKLNDSITHTWKMPVKGLEGPCVNDNILGRTAIMHYAGYAAAGGRSHGCFGMEHPESDKIVQLTEGGCLLYGFYCADGPHKCTHSNCTAEERAQAEAIWAEAKASYSSTRGIQVERTTKGQTKTLDVKYYDTKAEAQQNFPTITGNWLLVNNKNYVAIGTGALSGIFGTNSFQWIDLSKYTSGVGTTVASPDLAAFYAKEIAMLFNPVTGALYSESTGSADYSALFNVSTNMTKNVLQNYHSIFRKIANKSSMLKIPALKGNPYE